MEPLPLSWPFSPRTPSPELEAWSAALPGLTGPWTLEAVAGLALDGAAADLIGAFGRGGVARHGDVVLRPYRRGGLMRHVNARIYAGPERFRREVQVHRALWDAGFPTVEPLGIAFRRRLWGFEGVYLTRFSEGQPWPRTWAPTALPQVRMLVDALCAWGLYAPDLNATNFLVRPDGQVLALDWDRAHWAPGAPLLARYRERLARSLSRLGAPPDFVL